MSSKIPVNYQSIIHIINNWNFSYVDNRVKANLDVYVDLDELKILVAEYRTVISNPSTQLDPAEHQLYIDAINELDMAIRELEAANGSNIQ